MNRILLSLATLHLAASYTGLIKIKLHFFTKKQTKMHQGNLSQYKHLSHLSKILQSRLKQFIFYTYED